MSLSPPRSAPNSDDGVVDIKPPQGSNTNLPQTTTRRPTKIEFVIPSKFSDSTSATSSSYSEEVRMIRSPPPVRRSPSSSRKTSATYLDLEMNMATKKFKAPSPRARSMSPNVKKRQSGSGRSPAIPVGQPSSVVTSGVTSGGTSTTVRPEPVNTSRRPTIALPESVINRSLGSIVHELSFKPVAYDRSLRAVYLKSFCFLVTATVLSLVSIFTPWPWLAYKTLYEGMAINKVSQKTVYQTLYEECWKDDHLGIPETCESIMYPSNALLATRILLWVGTALTLGAHVNILIQLVITWTLETKGVELYPWGLEDVRWFLWAGLFGYVSAIILTVALFILKGVEGGSGSVNFFISLVALTCLVYGTTLAVFAKTLMKYEQIHLGKSARTHHRRWTVSKMLPMLN